jgi:hypothetical protein
MKSILLTSTKSPSNNNFSLSSSVGSHHNNRRNESLRHDTDDDNNVIENVDKEQYNKLLSHSNNIKKQVIRNKIIAKNDDKLKRQVSGSAGGGDNNENHPLIDSNVILNESDSNPKTAATKIINLRKKNGTLIFQRKSCSQPKQHQQQPSSAASEYQELKIESFKKRQSLQWPYSVVANNTTTASNKFDSRNRHSYSSSSSQWYDSRYPNAIEEEFENSVSKQ